MRDHQGSTDSFFVQLHIFSPENLLQFYIKRTFAMFCFGKATDLANGR